MKPAVNSERGETKPRGRVYIWPATRVHKCVSLHGIRPEWTPVIESTNEGHRQSSWWYRKRENESENKGE